jgi:hypothetical protein
MSFKSLSVLPLAGALVLFLTGSASTSVCLSPAPASPPACPLVCPPVCPPACPPACPLPGRETAVPAPRCPADQEKPCPQANRCGDPTGPIIHGGDPTPPAGPVAGPRNEACVPPPPPCPVQPWKHTMTIYNGSQVTQTTFVWRGGSWHNGGGCGHYEVLCRNCPRSPWQLHGTNCSPRRAEGVACSPRAHGHLASVRRHCR